jgi:hypothetical protein
VLDVAPNPATVGQAVTLTATVTESGADNLQPGTGIPRGSVTFKDGSATLMTVTVQAKAGTSNQGVAQFTTSALGLGNHSLTAQYSGEVFPPISLTATSTSGAVVETINPAAPPPTPVAGTPIDVTPLVSVALRRGLPRGQQLVTVSNTCGQAITGPLYLVFAKLPKRVHLKDAFGATRAHDPFLLDAVTLLPGGYATFLASSTGHKVSPISIEVFAGPGSP